MRFGRIAVAAAFAGLVPLEIRTSAADTASQTTAVEPAAGAVAVHIERPYEDGRRSRPEGPVLASLHDEELALWNAGGSAQIDAQRPDYHPAPRVTVDSLVQLGRLPKKGSHALSHAGILAQSRSQGYWPLRLCFEEGLRRDPKLGGTSRVRLTLRRSGRVQAARMLDLGLKDPDTGRCLVGAVKKLRFRPAPEKRVDLDLKIGLFPGDAPLPALAQPILAQSILAQPIPEGSAEQTKNSGFDVEHTLRALEADRERIAHCYEQGLSRTPGLWGRIELHVALTQTGKPLSVVERESRFPDAGVRACVERVVSSVLFPTPKT